MALLSLALRQSVDLMKGGFRIGTSQDGPGISSEMDRVAVAATTYPEHVMVPVSGGSGRHESEKD